MSRGYVTQYDVNGQPLKMKMHMSEAEAYQYRPKDGIEAATCLVSEAQGIKTSDASKKDNEDKHSSTCNKHNFSSSTRRTVLEYFAGSPGKSSSSSKRKHSSSSGHKHGSPSKHKGNDSSSKR